MQRATQKERFKFVQLLTTHSEATVNDARRLMRYGATLGRIAETECNSPDYPAYAWQLPEAERLECFKRIDQRYQQMLDRLEKKEERIRLKVEQLCAQFGCKPVFSGDPRGATLKIQVPDGYTNDWGKEGICVPTS
jgi:hypothetical protein